MTRTRYRFWQFGIITALFVLCGYGSLLLLLRIQADRFAAQLLGDWEAKPGQLFHFREDGVFRIGYGNGRTFEGTYRFSSFGRRLRLSFPNVPDVDVAQLDFPDKDTFTFKDLRNLKSPPYITYHRVKTGDKP